MISNRGDHSVITTSEDSSCYTISGAIVVSRYATFVPRFHLHHHYFHGRLQLKDIICGIEEYQCC